MKTDITASDEQLIEQVVDRYQQFISSLKKGAKLAFELGQMLRTLYGRLYINESWSKYVKEHFPFSYKTACTYIRVYENYKDNPKLLVDQTINGALNRLSAPPQEKRGHVEYGNPNKQLELPWEAIFSKPPVSQATLKNHRIECMGKHDIYLIRRGLNFPIKIVDLLTVDPIEHLKAPYQGMLDSIQAALELYYAEVERLEALKKL